jgi:hypothetical protein
VKRFLGWLAAFAALAYIVWALIEAASPLNELEELYPTTGDWYPWDLLRDAMKT